MNMITKLEVGKRNKERVNVYIDEEFAFAISAELIYKENISVKQVIDLEKISKLAEEDEFMKCKTSALRIVERTYKTEKEIKDKLKQKEYSNKSIERSMEFLKEYNLLNDSNYTRMYVSDKVKKYGKKKIKYDLIRKGVSEEVIELELDKVNEETISNKVIELANKKLRELRKRESDKYKISQKLYRFLASKGYEYDVISQTIKEVMENDN